jgi:hypothetical protein
VRRHHWKTRGKRVARATVAALLSLWALYVVGINALLSTSLFDRIVNQDRITLDIHYERGWSVWPTTIHARHLSIRASDSNVMWLLKLDDVTFDTSLLALPHRHFVAEHVRATGISMRIQQKLREAPTETDDIVDLPPMDGFPAFAVAPAGPHSPDLWDDRAYHLVTVDLDDVVANDVREIWVNRSRFSGHARIAGRFHLKPLREVDIGPVHVDVGSGQINRGFAHPIAKDLYGTADLTAHRFDPRDVHDRQFLHYFDIWTDLHTRFEDLSKLPFATPGDVYAAGVVDSQIRLEIERGILAKGTDITAETRQLHLARDGYMADAHWQLQATVDGRFRAKAQFSPLRITRSDGTELVRTRSLGLDADSTKLDLADGPFTDLHLVGEVDRATIENARMFNCLLPCSARVAEGSGEFSAHVEIWPQQRRFIAKSRFDYSRLRVALPAFDVAGDGTATLAFGVDWATGIVSNSAIHGHLLNTEVRGRAIALRTARVSDGALWVSIPHFALADPLQAMDAAVVIPDGSNMDIEIARDGARARGQSVIGASGLIGFRHRAIDVARGHVKLHGDAIAFDKGPFALIGATDLDLRVDKRPAGIEIRPSRIEVRDARATLDGHPIFTARQVELDGVRRAADIDAHARIRGLEAPDARVFQQLLPPDSKIRIVGGALRGNAELALGEVVTGVVFVHGDRLAIERDKSTLSGDVVAIAEISGAEADGKILNLDDSRIALRNIAVENAATSSWNGDLELKNARVTFDPPSFDSDFVLTADDARPILGMLETPRVIAGLIEMPRLKLVAHVDADADGLLFRDLRAAGGNVAVRGSYAIQNGDKRGAFIVEKGPFSMGVRIGNEGAHDAKASPKSEER